MMGEPVAMEPLVIRKEIEVEASPETVWRIIATAEGLRRWFGAETIVLEPRPGGRYEEHAVYDGEPHHVVGSVLVYDPPHRFVHGYRVQRADGTGWPVETIVSLSLTAVGARTRVTLEHSGFEHLPLEDARRVHQAWSGGWGAAFERLPAVVGEDAAPGMAPLVVRREIEIEAPPERVWPYVGTAEGYRSWSCPPAETHEVTLEPRRGGRFEDRMVVQGRVYHGIGEVVEYDPPRRIVLRSRSAEGLLRSTVDTITITLASIDGGTRVVVEHAGFEQLPAERQEQIRTIFDEGWADALAALRRLVATSADDPLHAEATKRLVVHKEIEIEAPPERVWPYVATKDGCRRWFCNVAEVYELTLEPRLGGRYEDRMVVKGKTYRSAGEVVAYEPPHRFAYRYQSRLSDGTLTPPNTVTITLIAQGGGTRVVLEETGFEQQPAEVRRRSFDSTDQGWAQSLEDLYGLLANEVLPELGRLLIYQSVSIDAPADRVWHYVATEAGCREELRLSYPPGNIEVERLDAREGGRWESAGVSAHSGDPYRQFGRILTCDPPRLLVFTLQEEGWPAETTVTYRLTESFGKTRVTLIHAGFESLPAERHQLTRKAYEIGRFGKLGRLRDLVEGREVAPQYPITIRQEIEIAASVERVWWFIGTEEGSLRRHRAESTPGEVAYQTEVLEPRVGGRYTLHGVFHGTPFQISGRVLAYDPPSLLALTWREEDWPVETLVKFRLVPVGPGRTRLVVVHSGFQHLPLPVRERAVREYEEGRRRGLEVLARLVEESTVAPPAKEAP